MTRELFDRQSELWAYLRRTDAANKKLVIFVHGFRGSYLSTWGELNDYLQHHADEHHILREWDYLFVGYETHSIKNFLEIAKIVGSQWESASTRQHPFDQNNYSRLALFGHSLGTLGLRQLVCAMSKQPSGMLNALHKTVLFGSPLNGSSLTGLAALAPLLDAAKGKLGALSPKAYPITRALEPDSPELIMLHAWNETIRQYGKGKFGPSDVILGTDDQVVGTGGLANWQGDRVHMTPLPHSRMVKTKNKGAATQNTVLNMLKRL